MIITKKRNWKIPLILFGIIFFISLGCFIGSDMLTNNQYFKIIAMYWSIGLFFGIMICPYFLNKETYNSSPLKLTLRTILYPLAVLLTAITIEMNFYPTILFFSFTTLWILWAILKKISQNKKISYLNILIICWMVIGLTATTGQILGYSNSIIDKINTLSYFLDLRLSLLIIIIFSILVISLGRVDFEKIETKEFFILKDDKINPFYIILSLIYVLINFLIQIFWWLGLFFIEWMQEFLKLVMQKSHDTKDSIIDLGIILFSIIGLYLALFFSQFIVEKYLILNNTFLEILPFIQLLLVVCGIALSGYTIIRLRNLFFGNKWKFILDYEPFNKEYKQFFEVFAFPILTSSIAGLFLIGINHYVEIINLKLFENIGVYTILLILAIIIALFYPRLSFVRIKK